MNIDLRVYDEMNKKQFMSYIANWCNSYHNWNIPTVPSGLGMAYYPMPTLFELARTVEY